MAVERAAGQVIAGRFRLVSILGTGGMGAVWAARHLTLNVDVAVKFIDPAANAQNEAALKRFDQEAKAAAAIQSPHIVNILDYGKDQSGRPYLAMELLKGEDLEQRLSREGPLPLADLQKIIGEACKGLTAAHSTGVIHRDLKPENVFLTEGHDGMIVKLLDFGIARTDPAISDHGNLTMTGQLIGTPMFMSPEQALGKRDLDGRSDLYSLAVVAFKCLTGQLPYDEADTVGEIIVAITTKEPRDLLELRKDLPPAVVAWMKKCLAKSRDDRYQTAKEMADALTEACEVRRMAASFSGLEVDDTVPPATDFDKIEPAPKLVMTRSRNSEPPKATPARQAPPEPEPRSRAWVSLLVVLLVAGAVFAWFKLHH
jgi:serine/threonine protein kinase